MILLTGFYPDKDINRLNEFLDCIRRNVANDQLHEIHLFIEDPLRVDELVAAYPLFAATKIRLIPHGRRLMYRDLIAYANRHLTGRRVIIANADIYFDHTLARLETYDLLGRILCLSRWDVQADGSTCLFDHPASQDAWIFQAPIREFRCDFHLGVLGCDNRLAWEADHAGLIVTNPSRSVRANHLHLSQVRRYSERQRLRGPTRSVPASLLPHNGPTDETAYRRTKATNPVETGRNELSTMTESIYALTSLVPGPENVSLTQHCLNSWRTAGLKVVAFNHPTEIVALAKLYDIDFIPVTTTTAAVFDGKHFVPIKAMLDWAVERAGPVVLINADIELRLADWEMKRIRWLADGGLCYFVRYNHNGQPTSSQRELYGIDAFFFQGRDAAELPDAFLSMGQPFWDYWLPHDFAVRGRPIYTVEFPAAFHRNHRSRWSWENWHRCGLEFARVTGQLGSDLSFEACRAMSVRVRQNFDQHKIAVPHRPFEIKTWVQHKFRASGLKTFLELGSHQGTDTAWLADLPEVTIHAFEPDPRNHQASRPNVTLHRAAITDRDGRGLLILSHRGWGQEWTYSSSIKRPKNHLHRYPVSFGDAVEVELVALDTVYQQQNLDVIDFIWADIQGAEGEMIRGGRRTLAHTRYLYTEYSDDELYENQVTLRQILEMLPNFRVLELWPDNVLLENRALAT